MQSDQSEYVLGRALLKDPFNCCIQQSYTANQRKLHVTLKMTTHWAFNVEECWPKRSAAAVAEQRTRDITDNENKWKDIWFASSKGGGGTMWESQGHVQFDELTLG